ncbi:MAG TPA: DUF362 domain-containing protein [Candidatus Polarisedimenticolaceae bacterium]|nr:DUF362 domain-containing protein [Candidatus Polarisedimenticolaceae bacterium]
MSDVRLRPLGGYDRTAELRRFIAETIDGAPGTRALFSRADPRRLVVVKPNWIQQSHEDRPGVWEPVITNPRLVVAAVEVVAERLDGIGTICLCDAPHTYADFLAIVARGNLPAELDSIRSRWPQLRVELIDLRRETWARKEQVVVERRPNPEDPRGYVRLNLGRDSLFYRHRGEGRFYGADYDSAVVNEHHRGEIQEYLLAGSPLACDLFVNLPKLKTHKKTGLTCCLKNLVGINGDKNWLPHHTEGSPRDGGDEFPSGAVVHTVERELKKAGRRLALNLPGVGTWLYRKARNVGKQVLGDSHEVVRNGNWHGNDSCWRMALDLNRALLYGNRDGSWRSRGQAKPYVAIVDGIVGGEGNGPLCPDPVDSRVLIGGDDPAAIDAVACRLMGFDPRSLPIVAGSFETHRWPIAAKPMESLRVRDERIGADVALDRVEPAVPGGFRPHFGWTVLRSSA